MDVKVLVFVPMYNCSQQISRVIDQLSSSILSIVQMIIFVDNGSTDLTIETAKTSLNSSNILNWAIFKNAENYSLGGSHKVAFNYAIEHNFSHVVVFHGDDQGKIKDFQAMLAIEELNSWDCILGARFMKGSNLIGYSKFRTFGNYGFNLLFSGATARMIYDLGSGLNLYSVPRFVDRQYLKFPDNLNFNHYMLLNSLHRKHRILFHPISWREYDQVSNVKLYKFTLSTIRILLMYLFRRKHMFTQDHSTRKNCTYKSEVLFSSED